MGRCQQYVVVTVAVDTGVDAVDEAAVAAVLEDVVEVVAIETEGEATQNFPLADTVTEREACRDFTTKSDVAELFNIHEYNEPEKDGAELEEHLLEKDRELTDIKGFTLVHTATEDVRPVPHKVADCFDYSPGARIGRDSWLVGKLEIMKTEDFPK